MTPALSCILRHTFHCGELSMLNLSRVDGWSHERARGNWLTLMLAYRVMRVRYIRFRRRGEASGINEHITEQPIWSCLLKHGLKKR